MENLPIYKDNNFTLTKEMFISGNARFSMFHLSSIRLVKSRREIPYNLLILEILFIVGGLAWKYPYHGYVALLGFLGLLGSVIYFIFRKPIHKLILIFASGEREVIAVTDYVYLEKLANAFSRALVEATSKRMIS
ncbi:MAG: DUF6232 family protein [Candidatus Cohnella colombiensis]|uniref:DUF6232 family protein n=1 Tax=Candidatus Cohnella colombiensis TaxID=3121368 RepID=A0AA95JCS6_9BACL|nr:MAG: DUF6232 family protein [Cohnella sp.]